MGRRRLCMESPLGRRTPSNPVGTRSTKKINNCRVLGLGAAEATGLKKDSASFLIIHSSSVQSSPSNSCCVPTSWSCFRRSSTVISLPWNHRFTFLRHSWDFQKAGIASQRIMRKKATQVVGQLSLIVRRDTLSVWIAPAPTGPSTVSLSGPCLCQLTAEHPVYPK